MPGYAAPSMLLAGLLVTELFLLVGAGYSLLEQGAQRRLFTISFFCHPLMIFYCNCRKLSFVQILHLYVNACTPQTLQNTIHYEQSTGKHIQADIGGNLGCSRGCVLYLSCTQFASIKMFLWEGRPTRAGFLEDCFPRQNGCESLP